MSFNNRFEGDRRDVNLIAKLLAELPGILNIALRGAARLLVRKEFTECPSSDAIKDEWRLEADQVRQFVEEYCGEKPDQRVASRKVFSSYQAWAREAGSIEQSAKIRFPVDYRDWASPTIKVQKVNAKSLDSNFFATIFKPLAGWRRWRTFLTSFLYQFLSSGI